MKKRTVQDVFEELNGIERAFEAMFSLSVDKPRIQAQVTAIINARIEDYLHQRLRDWQTHDLIELLAALERPETALESPPVETEAPVEGEPQEQAEMAPRKRGRPKKV